MLTAEQIDNWAIKVPQDSEITTALKPWAAWCAACMEAAPLAPDELVWAGYGPNVITMGNIRMMYFLASALKEKSND